MASLVVAGVIAAAHPADAQAFEVSPAIGYRVGDLPLVSSPGTVAGTDGAASYSITLDVKYARDRAIEALFSHQLADADLYDVFGVRTRVRVAVDYWHGGATQEFDFGRVRPFVAGTLGVTRYGEAGHAAVRFSLGAGGGVKIMATPNVGLKLDGRVYATLVDGDSSIGFCGPGVCVLHLHVGVLWQADFSAGVLFSF